MFLAQELEQLFNAINVLPISTLPPGLLYVHRVHRVHRQLWDLQVVSVNPGIP